MPRVSVVITSYNSGALLERAVRSVLAQTVQDLEIVVVDDGSISPQPEIVDLDPRIRFHAQSNRGVSSARNVGVRLAQAEFIAFLDHDDEWRPEKLARQLESVDDFPHAAFWMTGFDWILPDRVVPAPGNPINYRGMLRGTMISTSTVMVRKSDFLAVGGYSPLLTHIEDGDLYMRLAMEDHDPAVRWERLADYNLQEPGATADYRAVSQASRALLDRHADRARRRNDLDSLMAIHIGRRRARELFAFQAIDALRHRPSTEWRHAIGDFMFAMRSRPSVAIHSLMLAIIARTERAWRALTLPATKRTSSAAGQSRTKPERVV